MPRREYSKNYHAKYMRLKRQKIVDKNPIALCKTVWVVEGSNGEQIVFKNKRDINIKRIPKVDLKENFIKGY